MMRLKKFTIALMLSAATLAVGIASPFASAQAAPVASVTRSSAPRTAVAKPNYAWQMFVATNASRHRYGLPSLKSSPAAARVALAHARAMANANSLYHSTAITPYLAGAGRVSSWGENIGWTTGRVADLERAFMASPDHRPHILSSSFHHIAIGAVLRGHRLWVSVFFYG
jgi:uncharacterized protein YkwD